MAKNKYNTLGMLDMLSEVDDAINNKPPKKFSKNIAVLGVRDGSSKKYKQNIFIESLKDYERDIEKWLGYPMQKARDVKKSEQAVTPGTRFLVNPLRLTPEQIEQRELQDNERHSAAGYYAAKAITDKFPEWSQYTGIPQAIGTLGSIGLGIGHEITSNKYTRPHEDDPYTKWNVLTEAIEDVTSNTAGAIMSAIPFMSESEKIDALKYMSDNNMLPDGVDFPNGENLYWKNEKGEINKPYKKKQYGGLAKFVDGGGKKGTKENPFELPEITITPDTKRQAEMAEMYKYMPEDVKQAIAYDMENPDELSIPKEPTVFDRWGDYANIGLHPFEALAHINQDRNKGDLFGSNWYEMKKQERGVNPLDLAFQGAAAARLAGAVLPTAMSWLNAPAVIAGTEIPGATLGNALASEMIVNSALRETGLKGEEDPSTIREWEKYAEGSQDLATTVANTGWNAADALAFFELKPAYKYIVKPLKQELIYNAVDPMAYGVRDKLLSAPRTLLRNLRSSDADRVNRLAAKHFSHPGIISSNWETQKRLAQNRLDAFRVGLGLDQKFNTFQKNLGEDFYRINNFQIAPDDFASLYNDIETSKILKEKKGLDEIETNRLLMDLHARHELALLKDKTSFKTAFGDMDPLEFIKQNQYLRPWTQRNLVDLKAANPNFEHSVYDNDVAKAGIMGGYRWDVTKTPEGALHFQANDTWDLNPWQKRGEVFTNQQKYKQALRPFKNLEFLKLLGGKPYKIRNDFYVDPKTFEIIDAEALRLYNKPAPNPELGEPLGKISDLTSKEDLINPTEVKKWRDPETGEIIYQLEKEDYDFGNDWKEVMPEHFKEYVNKVVNKYYSESGGFSEYADQPKFREELQKEIIKAVHGSEKTKKLTSEDFFTHKEIEDMVNQYVEYYKKLDEFEKANPQSGTDMIMSAFTGNNAYMDKFHNLNPNVSLPNWFSKAYPDFEEFKVYREHLPAQIRNRSKIDPNILKYIGQNEDKLLKSAKELNRKDDWFYTAKPKDYVSEMRGSLGLSMKDIEKMSEKELEKAAKKIFQKMEKNRVDRYKADIENPFTGFDAYQGLSPNKFGGNVSNLKKFIR